MASKLPPVTRAFLRNSLVLAFRSLSVLPYTVTVIPNLYCPLVPRLSSASASPARRYSAAAAGSAWARRTSIERLRRSVFSARSFFTGTIQTSIWLHARNTPCTHAQRSWAGTSYSARHLTNPFWYSRYPSRSRENSILRCSSSTVYS